MVLVISRLFLFLLLAADYAGDPYCGQSPLSRPFSSQDCFCHSIVQRAILLKTVTPIWSEIPILPATSDTFTVLDTRLPMRNREVEHSLLSATDPLYALMSLQC
jgi:hypothetical protein